MSRRAASSLAFLVAACSGTTTPSSSLPTATVKGGFTDVTPANLPATLAAKDPAVDEPTNGAFLDLDGDGRDELVLSSDDGTGAYRWDDASGAFVRLEAEPPFAKGLLLDLVDLDGDGQLDQLSSRRFVQWGPAKAMSPPDEFVAEAGWGDAGNLVATDVDGDGRLDLVGGGPCCWNQACHDVGVFLQEAPRNFRLLGAESGLPTHPDYRIYLGAVVPLDPEPLVARIGEPCGDRTDAPSFFRTDSHDPSGFPVFSGLDPMPPNALFREGDPKRGLSSPMGAASGDLDGDGRLDFVVSTNPYLEIQQGTDAWPMVTRTAASGIGRHPGEENFQIPWSIVIADFDRDGRADLVVTHGNDLNSRTKPAAHVGPQVAALYLNRGGFRFADASTSAGMPIGQWKALAVGDFDCDGDADLVVGGEDAWPRVLRNDIEGGHGISFRFRGSNGDPTGAGARVDVWPDGGGAVQHLVAGAVANPEGVAPPMAFAGLGSAEKAAKVRVTWPSGVVQELLDVDADRCVRLDEPQVFEISPTSRSLPANGVATVRVIPRDPSGAPSGARAEVRIASGPGTLATASIEDGVEVSIQGTGAGTTVLEVLIDGVPLRVHPRLWWTP